MNTTQNSSKRYTPAHQKPWPQDWPDAHHFTQAAKKGATWSELIEVGKRNKKPGGVEFGKMAMINASARLIKMGLLEKRANSKYYAVGSPQDAGGSTSAPALGLSTAHWLDIIQQAMTEILDELDPEMHEAVIDFCRAKAEESTTTEARPPLTVAALRPLLDGASGSADCFFSDWIEGTLRPKFAESEEEIADFIELHHTAIVEGYSMQILDDVKTFRLIESAPSPEKEPAPEEITVDV